MPMSAWHCSLTVKEWIVSQGKAPINWRVWLVNARNTVYTVVGILLIGVLASIGLHYSGLIVGTLWEVIRWVFSCVIWFFWDGLFAYTVGMPFWWLSNYTGATPLSPLMVFLLYMLYCINCISDDNEAGGARMILSYIVIFIVGLCFRLG